MSRSSRASRVRTVLRAAIVLIASLPAAVLAQPPSNEELERKLDALTREIESLRLGEVADISIVPARVGLAPAAAKVYGAPRGVSIGGYGEVLLQKFDRERENGTASALEPRLDALRLVSYIGYKFDESLLFNSEVEWEHGGVGDEVEVEVDTTGAGSGALSGEAIVEFAYLDWAPRAAVGVRAGLLLVPVGFINEQHEPPVYIGARRSDLERVILPATWSAIGAGLYGELRDGLNYRAYVTEGLDAAGFSARTAIRGGRQQGRQSTATHAAFTARLDWSPSAAALIGASVFTGNSWQGPQPAGAALAPVVTLFDVHARWQARGLTARALWASGSLTDAGALSDALGLTGSARLGEHFGGASLEAAYDLLPLLSPGTRFTLAPYARYERFDTQDQVAGGSENPAYEITTILAGLEFRPHSSVVARLDRESRRSEADDAVSQWNVAVGYLF